jgi:hypothetical protein
LRKVSASEEGWKVIVDVLPRLEKTAREVVCVSHRVEGPGLRWVWKGGERSETVFLSLQCCTVRQSFVFLGNIGSPGLGTHTQQGTQYIWKSYAKPTSDWPHVILSLFFVFGYFGLLVESDNPHVVQPSSCSISRLTGVTPQKYVRLNCC